MAKTLPTINVHCHVVGVDENQRYYISIEGEPFERRTA